MATLAEKINRLTAIKEEYMAVISNIRIGLSILMFVSLSLPLAGQNTQVNTQPDITPILESVIKSDSILHSGPYRLDKDREVLLLGSGAVMSLTGLTLMNNVTPLTQQEIAQIGP